MFRILIPILLLSIQYLLYARTRNWLQEKYPGRRHLQWIAAGLFLVFNAALVYVAVMRPKASEYPAWFLYGAVYPFFLWHGTTVFIGLLLLVSWIVKLPFRLIGAALMRFKPARIKITNLQQRPAYQKFDASRRTFIRRGMYSLTAASFGASAYGMFVGRNEHEITEALFPIENLPPELSGFTIAMLSDVHSSINMQKGEMEEFVRIANSTNCDMIIVTGDFVNSMTEEVYPFAEAFSNLSAPHGVFGVMGNHDFFTRQPELVAREVNDCGVKLLRNDKVLIEKNGGKFYLLGVDDVGTPQRADAKMTAALGYAPLNIPKILMIHRPYFLEQAAINGVDLVLSGHTHGGQIVLANLGNVVIAPASLASRYVWGKYSLGRTQMYVNRGIGTVGLPIRINCPPEITRITLVPKVPRT